MPPRVAPSRSMAATVASSTPDNAPRQPACAAPITARSHRRTTPPAIRRAHTDCKPDRAGDDGVGARARVAGPWLLGDNDVGRVNLIGGEEAVRLDGERGRHARAIFGDMAGMIARADAAIET